MKKNFLRKIKNNFFNIIFNIKRKIFYIKDYQRLEHDYSCVLAHATLSRMSKTNYNLQTIYNVIDDAQQEFHFDFIKSDLINLIKDGGKIEDIENYITQL